MLGGIGGIFIAAVMILRSNLLVKRSHLKPICINNEDSFHKETALGEKKDLLEGMQNTSESGLGWVSSLAPHERLPEMLVMPREKTPTCATARGNP